MMTGNAEMVVLTRILKKNVRKKMNIPAASNLSFL